MNNIILAARRRPYTYEEFSAWVETQEGTVLTGPGTPAGSTPGWKIYTIDNVNFGTMWGSPWRNLSINSAFLRSGSCTRIAQHCMPSEAIFLASNAKKIRFQLVSNGGSTFAVRSLARNGYTSENDTAAAVFTIPIFQFWDTVLNKPRQCDPSTGNGVYTDLLLI